MRHPFSKSSQLSPSLPPWRPAIQGWELCFVFLFCINFYHPVLWGWRFGFSGIYHVNFLCGFPRILISLFVHIIWERRNGRQEVRCVRHIVSKGRDCEKRVRTKYKNFLTIHVNTGMDGHLLLSKTAFKKTKNHCWNN